MKQYYMDYVDGENPEHIALDMDIIYHLAKENLIVNRTLSLYAQQELPLMETMIAMVAILAKQNHQLFQSLLQSAAAAPTPAPLSMPAFSHRQLRPMKEISDDINKAHDAMHQCYEHTANPIQMQKIQQQIDRLEKELSETKHATFQNML